MPDLMRFTILGCGSSPGVPRITGDWGVDPLNPKNRRRRASLLIQRISENGGKTTVVIDTGPDFRDQMITSGVTSLDGVVYTHAHADHIHGIDDLRGFWLEQKRLIDVYADAFTLQRLREGFGYILTSRLTAHIRRLYWHMKLHTAKPSKSPATVARSDLNR